MSSQYFSHLPTGRWSALCSVNFFNFRVCALTHILIPLPAPITTILRTLLSSLAPLTHQLLSSTYRSLTSKNLCDRSCSIQSRDEQFSLLFDRVNMSSWRPIVWCLHTSFVRAIATSK
jgi:hypothetical protein